MSWYEAKKTGHKFIGLTRQIAVVRIIFFTTFEELKAMPAEERIEAYRPMRDSAAQNSG